MLYDVTSQGSKFSNTFMGPVQPHGKNILQHKYIKTWESWGTALNSACHTREQPSIWQQVGIRKSWEDEKIQWYLWNNIQQSENNSATQMQIMKDIGFQIKVCFLFHQRHNSSLCRYFLFYKMNTSYFKILYFFQCANSI